MPFAFRRDGHVVHGFIDLLYRAPDGVWTVVDHKTDNVACDEAELRRHARIYHLQMAVYAEAISALTGGTPRAVVVFLRCPAQPVVLDAAELRAELDAVPLRTLVEMLREETS
jgi:hypothetical protein